MRGVSGNRHPYRDQPPFSRRLEFLHFGTDFLTVPPRIDQAEAHALYQGMASAVPNRERNGALAPGDGKTCTPCSSGQHPEFSAYVLRHHQDQPRPRPVAVGTECHVDDRRASLLRSGQEIPAPRLCRNARPSAFIGDGRRRHDGGKGHAVSQGRILIPLEEGMGPFGRGLAAWLLRDARGVSAELHKASGIHSGEPGEGGTVERPEEFPYCFTYLARRKAAGATALN